MNPTIERVTPHQVAGIASKLRPADAKVLYALKNQMIDDIRQKVEDQKRRREMTEALDFYARNNHLWATSPDHNRLEFEDCDSPECVRAREILKSTDAPKAELLKALEQEQK